MLQHVALEVGRDDVDACVELWALLGFERMDPPPLLADRFVWLQREGTQIHLMPLDDPLPTRRGHAAVVPGDYDATIRALHDAGYETDEGENAWNAPRVFIRDPAGNRIEVMSAPPYPPWP
jgi:catechol 2,3-dioxygenase-like lactoylglutathione lyase family enzyme